MIWVILINFIANILTALISILPNADSAVTAIITGGVSTLNGYLSAISWIFPSELFVTMLKAIMGFELTMIGIRVTMWLFAHASLGFIKNRI